MGKRRHGSPIRNYESESDAEDSNRYVEEYASHRPKHKKSKKHKYIESDMESESKYERKRHKHKKQKERSEEEDSASDQSEKERRHSSHKKKKYRDHSKYDKKRKKERNGGHPSSKWDEEVEQQIKSEPLSDDDHASRRHSRARREENESPREEWGQRNMPVKPKEEKTEKDKVNFGLSGKLTEDTNTFNGIVIKYSQPQEARKPKRRWRWYIFKGDEELPFLPLHRQSAYLIGRERKVADIPTDHPSCSKQHAVFQYRLVSYDRLDGTKGRTVKPYILDLESANGTYVNNRRIEPRRYVELLEKDVVKFGYSSREYVLLHEASKGSDDDEMSQDNNDISPISLLTRNDL